MKQHYCRDDQTKGEGPGPASRHQSSVFRPRPRLGKIKAEPRAERVGANGGAPLPQEATSKDRRIRDREGTQIKTRGPYKQASRDGTTTLQRQPKGRRGNANRQELYPKQCNSDQKQDPSLGPEPRPMPKRGPELRSLPSRGATETEPLG